MFVLCLALGAGAARADTAPDPQKLVQQLYQSWTKAVRAERAAIEKDKSVLYALTESSTEPYVDYDRLSRLVLGRNWTAANEAQRARFVEEFRNYLVRTYATAMWRYVDAELVLKPTSYNPADRQVWVRTETVPVSGQRFPVNFLLYRTDGEWKAQDVSIEGVSVVATLRGVVDSEVRQKGLDGVIEDLARKSREAG